MRFELPPGLTAEEEAAVRAAVRACLGVSGPVGRPDPWAMAGRTGAARPGPPPASPSRDPWTERPRRGDPRLVVPGWGGRGPRWGAGPWASG